MRVTVYLHTMLRTDCVRALITQAHCTKSYAPGTSCLLFIDIRPEGNKNFARPQCRHFCNSMQHSPSAEVNGCSYSHIIFCILWHQTVQCPLQNSQINSVYTSPLYFLKTRFNIIFLFMPGSPRIFLPSGFTPKFCVHLSSLPCVLNALSTNPSLCHHHKRAWLATRLMRPVTTKIFRISWYFFHLTSEYCLCSIHVLSLLWETKHPPPPIQ